MSILDIQKKIIDKLLATSTITAKVSTRIYPHIIQNTTFPYVKVSVKQSTDFDFKESNFEYKAKIQVFSRSQSNKEAIEIMELIFLTLNRKEETFTGITHIQQSNLDDLFIEDDGITWQSIKEFTICT